MSFRAGNLRERITIERPTAVPDGYGGQVDGWEAVATSIAAEVKPISGNATTEAEVLVGTATHRIMIRLWGSTAGVDATHRVIWRGRAMKVLGAVPDFARRMIDMTVEAGAVLAIAAVTLTSAAAFHSHAAAAGELTPDGLPPMPAITRYVDLTAGDNSADGLTPATAWRHAPAMEGETDNAAAYTPVAGDHIAIKRGGRFHGRWAPRGSGAAGNPVLYSGNAWGTGAPALIDGAQPVTTVRVPIDQADAGGATNWNDPAMRVVEWTDDGRETVLYDAAGMLFTSQWPRPLDPYLIDDFFAGPGLSRTVSGTQLNLDRTIVSAEIAAQASGEAGVGEVWVWVESSQFARRKILSVSGSTVTLEGGAFSPTAYEPDTEIFLFSCVKHVTQPGDYAVIAPGKAIVLTRDSTAIRRAVDTGSVLTWKSIRVSGSRADIEYRGFEFTGFANVNPISFTSSGGGPQRMRVRGCTFRDQWNTHALDGTWTIDAEFSWNRFTNMVLTGGISDQGTRTSVHHNVIDGAGGTAIPSSRDVDGGLVTNNIVSRVGGVHANGMSNYGGQKNTEIVDNVIFSAERPLTVQTKSSTAPLLECGRRIEGNVFLARWTEEARAGVWALRFNSSDQIDGAICTRNIAIGDAGAISTYRTHSDFTYTNNWGFPDFDDQGGTPDRRGTWTTGGNTVIAATYLDPYLIETDRCDILRPDSTRLTIDLRSAGAA
jgi:SPP1 family predicted phage head-tail adaptor